jgi:beta-glucosidase
MKNGKVKPVEAMMEFMEYMPWYVRRVLFGDPKKGSPLYQYTSAFPVGTALAQTWNPGLVERIVKAVGTEMVEFGVTFLLAPGMNIHRNPLCGRNYEYYSEDPLLTGKMAAAAARGVQSHEGCYVTIKHFAANNQETNRHHSNSVISERALREIYLKGFRIAVEEAGAKAVMTSYNKLNGTYTPNSYDLCTKLLRREWGFNGVVMTDWYSTGNGLAGNGLSIKAGNDLICPGGSPYYKSLKEDIKAGIVSIDDVKLSCSRILEAVLKSRIKA